MSTSTADNHFTFALPSLSYIDTSLEERTPAIVRPAPSRSLADWIAHRVATIRRWNAERRALSELSLMSDRELMDVGLNRGDFVRMFDDTANEDLKSRGLNA